MRLTPSDVEVRPLSGEARLQVASALRRFGAFSIDAALFVLVVLALVRLDAWFLEGALGLYAPFELEERLVEQSEETLKGDVFRILRTYEEVRRYENGTQAIYLRYEEHREGARDGGERWEIDVTRYELVEGDEGRPGRYGIHTLAFLIMLPLPYRYVLESSAWQGTLGKRLLGIKVVDWDLNRPTQGKILERNLWRFLSVGTFGFGYLMILFTRHHQALHDKLAKTLVVQARNDEVAASWGWTG